ncbi:MAG: T9SS type A sorting domain-containing protein, partial [Bacteroidota bacterium]
NTFFDIVNFIGAFGTTDWTAGWSNFNCVNTYYVGIEDVVRGGSISVYPQPVTGDSRLRFDAVKSGQIELSLLDLQGRIVRSFADRYFEAGSHQLEMPLESLQSGLYLLRFSTNGGQSTFKVVKN